MFSELTPFHWFGIGVFFMLLDVMAGASFFLLWLGLSAITVAIFCWLLPTLHPEYQILLFAIQSFASIIFWRIYLKSHPPTTDRPSLNRRAEQYIGRLFTLDQPIVNRRGQVRVDDSYWRIESKTDLPMGVTVKVIGVDGLILKVEPI
jgi:membrane protein implicated in regulation of membrane protease activity